MKLITHEGQLYLIKDTVLPSRLKSGVPLDFYEITRGADKVLNGTDGKYYFVQHIPDAEIATD